MSSRTVSPNFPVVTNPATLIKMPKVLDIPIPLLKRGWMPAYTAAPGSISRLVSMKRNQDSTDLSVKRHKSNLILTCHSLLMSQSETCWEF